MAESKFIRSMALAAAIAKSTGDNITQTLLDRAQVEDDPVRKGILQLMTDKRFLDSVSPVMMWLDDAVKALEEFADSLESEQEAGHLTEERVKVLTEDFFIVWSMLMKKKKPVYEASRKARRKARMAAIGKSDDEDEEEDGPGRMRKGAGKDGLDGMGIGRALSQFIKTDESASESDEVGMGIGSGDPKLEQQKRENVFLRSIPESLRKLAMLIGRAGEDDIPARGRFLTASKSDIEGITVGNNLSALLPAEIALLSERSTEDVFFRNYAEKRLQVFASASLSTQSEMHKDGPVIICVDESSSMDGLPLQTAITLAYAVTIIAKRRHRQVLVVAYSDSHKMLRVDSLGRQKRQLLDFLSSISMGGNDENSMFEWLFLEILPKEEKFKTADILCISDFGWVSIDSYVKDLIDQQKAAGMKFYGLNIGGVFGSWKEMEDDYWDGTRPMSVCDSVWDYHNGQCVEVKNTFASAGHRNKKH